MNRREAELQLTRQLQQRVALIKSDLEQGEMVRNAGLVNDYQLNTLENLAAGEALLFITDRRLLLMFEASGATRSWPFESLRDWAIENSSNRQMRELVLRDNSGVTRLIGGRMFLDIAKRILRAHPLRRS